MCLFKNNRSTAHKVLLSNRKWPYSKQNFKRVQNILRDLEWVTPRESQLYELLYDLLQCEEERNLIEELLRKVIFLSDDDMRSKVGEIADVILNQWKCSENDTVIVGAKNNDSADGGDVFIYYLRNYLGWKESRVRTTYNILSEGEYITRVIIADDFIGTGKRMHEVISPIKGEYRNLQVYFVSVGMMESIVKKEYPAILKCTHYVPVIVSPGMNHEKDKRVALMTQIESYLAQRWKDLSLDSYHLGYKKSGALYWNRALRVPNNVYPVFWWGAKADGTPFNPIMSVK